MKQYVGLVIIVKELTIFWIYHHFLVSWSQRKGRIIVNYTSMTS